VPADLIADDLLDELYQLAVATATGAAKIVARYATSSPANPGTKSSPTDMVSDADRASEAYIVSQLLSSRPDDGVVGEEGSSHEGTSGVSWVADPLDGTTNFFFGVPIYSVSLAAQVGDRTVVGAVVDVASGEVWSAARGRGAWRDGQRCAVAEGRSSLSTALVATGFSYHPEVRAEQARVLATLLPAVRDIRRLGSAALDLCGVAGGLYDAFYETGLNAWDWAAGGLVCEEAGGELIMLPGKTLLASTRSLSKPLGELISSTQAGGHTSQPGTVT